MNVGTFMALSRQGKVAAIERRANIVRSLCALCGTPLNGNDYVLVADVLSVRNAMTVVRTFAQVSSHELCRL